jgi:hypothetical protein
MKILTIFCLLVISSTPLFGQNMGVKLPVSTLPNTTLDVNGSVAFREGTTALPLVNGANNNIVLGDMSFVRITGPTADFNVSGFGNGQNGRILVISNETTALLTLKNLSALSNAINQIRTTGVDIIIRPNGTATLIYNTTVQKWLIISAQGWVNIPADGNETFIVKPMDESIVNLTTPQDDDDFIFTVGSNDIWLVEGILFVNDGGSDSGLSLAFDVGTATEKISAIGYAGGSLIKKIHINATAVTYDLGADNTNSVHFKGIIIGPASGTATFKIKWAQKNNKPTPTVVLQNSFAQFTKVR